MIVALNLYFMFGHPSVFFFLSGYFGVGSLKSRPNTWMFYGTVFFSLSHSHFPSIFFGYVEPNQPSLLFILLTMYNLGLPS